jgi:crotonobetainyl-CoA:carnitine CoA-transferase CaiB-like acyl-CoA transferase
MDISKQIADLAPMAAGPLAGVLVLELCGDEPSGTLGTQILGDLGATVIKIERFGADRPEETNDEVTMDKAYFWGMNRNKLSLACNLKAKEGRAIFESLAAIADVVYDNHRVGVTKRLGADPDTLWALNPRLVICSVTGFGHSGTRTKDPAYDVTIQALGGGMSLTGTGGEDEPPVRYGNPIGGIAGGLYAVIGILAALRQRRKSGEGDRLDLALMDAQLELHGYRVPAGASEAVEFGPEPHRGGSGALPYGPFRTKDGGWFVLGITAQFWKSFCQVVNRPDWVDAPQYATEADRQRNEAQLNADVAQAMAEKNGDMWQDDFIRAAIPGSKVCSVRDAFDHPHVALRDMLVDFPDHPLGSRLKVAGNPIKMSNHGNKALAPAPGLGEHTQLILNMLLGMDQAQITELNTKGAVWFPATGRSYARHSVV